MSRQWLQPAGNPLNKRVAYPLVKRKPSCMHLVKGYSFKKSPAAFSVVSQAIRKSVPSPTPIVHDSTEILPTDTAALEADELPPTYEGAPFFVVTTDSAFHTMVLQSNGKATAPDSVTTPVDFRKEFLLVLYAPPAAMTEASADLSVDAVVPDAGVLYVSTSSYYSGSGRLHAPRQPLLAGIHLQNRTTRFSPCRHRCRRYYLLRAVI